MANTSGGKGSTRIAHALKRLLCDTAGNTMPIMAAAIFPLVAMVGGAVDVSRMYATQTRLQQACDAGALATRRAMAATAPTTADIAEGNKFFDFNFPSGSFGTTSSSRTFAAGTTAGTITGTATAVLPTSVMQLFGYDNFTLTANCSSTLSIPNTDVVFVLDTSGSMLNTISGDSQSKEAALRQAVKDFYKELGPGNATGPGRIRYGFVPYAANVNVGKLIPTTYFRDSNDYQSRRAVTNTVQTWTAGADTPASPTYGSFTPATRGTARNVTSDYGTFAVPTGTGTVTVLREGMSSVALARTLANSPQTSGSSTFVASNSTNCAYNNTLAGSSNTMVAVGDNVGTVGAPTGDYSTPSHPTASQNKTLTRSRTNTISGYRYRWFSVSGTNACRLEVAPGKTSSPNTRWSQSQTATQSRTITWTPVQEFSHWSYESETVNVSGLKNGTNWNNSFDVPALATGSIGSYNRSGDSSSTSITGATTLNVPWAGCIEEANTVNTITATSSLTIPSNAYDMQIDLVPSTDAQRWRPLLPHIEYDRNNSNQWQADPTYNNSGWAICVSQASRLAQYTSDVVSGLSTSFSNYVDGLVMKGGTQHDIGMVWGARFLSPNGIFSADNSDANAPGGFQVGRHLVFMTDGAMDSRNQSYGPWGIAYLDGRDVPTDTLDSDNSDQTMNDIHYRRMLMICNAAKSKGYTVWVIGFGISTMPTALQNCATDSDHAALITSSTALKAKFKAIAETIGGLRLTS